MLNNFVKSIMTKEVTSVFLTDSIDHVIRTLDRADFDHLPVVDNETNLLGIISKTDLYRKLLSLSQNTSGHTYTEKTLFSTLAEEIMTTLPITVSQNDSIKDATTLLLTSDVHALPVIYDGKLIGIVTTKDIIRHLSEPK